VRQNTWVDYVLRVITIAGLSMPTFWTGVLAIFFLVILFNWIPPFEYANPFKNPLGSLQQLILPALVLSYSQLAEVARITRSSMLEVLREDYIRTAQAKGLRQIVVLRRHALRNALIPVLTMAGVQFAFMLNGSIVVETIFNLKGVGFLMIEAVQNRDYPVIEMLIMLIGVLVVFVNLVVDVLYGYIDPRIRTGGSAL
jgi:peptide/nickel transport system permease protein